ncbi:MAG TPA: methylenetetrahydrofolate--tRNA-(uracil(54)-C(5))-methyltransferase (FADH(2)-oxidizing) TrmFO, partial [Desulfobulbaceae bacterium]|nr:methylenetetrahydrofolate--tRNA-(uracil(54)-C(5))-methyltransferase (FADH(2)-oxidizing) TrmFO [Desulfobulbaceae bacterium]
LLAGLNAARLAMGLTPRTPPPSTALGALIRHLTESDPAHFQPSNVTFGLFPPWQDGKMAKKLRGQKRAEKALLDLDAWRAALS